MPGPAPDLRAAAPAGLRVVLDPTVRRHEDGTVLVGGTPLRLLRLTPAGARLVDGWAAGQPVGPAPAARRLARRLLQAGMAHPSPEPAPARSRDVAVVIPVRDDPAGLAATLAALGAVGWVLVVDDGSWDPRSTAAVAGAAGAEVLRHDRPLGPGQARQTGWRAASSEVVAFVDAGCRPSPGWLGPLLGHLTDGAVAAVAPRVRPDVSGVRPPALATYEERRSSLDLGPLPAPVRPRSRVPYVPTAALVARRAALADVGGFDPGLRYGEDVDLVWRLAGAGWTVRYEPAAEVAHDARPDLRSWLRQRVAYGSSAAPLAARHGPAVAPLAISGWSAAAWALAGLGEPAAGATLAAATTVRFVDDLAVLRRPGAEAVRIAGLGNLLAGRAVADAVRRAWWPLALLAATGSRRARLAVALSAAPLVAEWVRTRPPLDPLRWLALRMADDLAYGAGVWAGCARTRSLAALRPELTGGRTRDVVGGPPEPT